MKPTAHFVGMLEQTGRSKKDNVLFANLELKDRKAQLLKAIFAFYAPVFLNFRQLGGGLSTSRLRPIVPSHLLSSPGRPRQGLAAQGYAGTLYERNRGSGFQNRRCGRCQWQSVTQRRGITEITDAERRVQLLAGYRYFLGFRSNQRRAASLSIPFTSPPVGRGGIDHFPLMIRS